MSSYDWQPIDTRPLDGQGMYLKTEQGSIRKLKSGDDLRDYPDLVEGDEDDMSDFVAWSAL